MPRLYDYTDYREYLHDWYTEKKQANPGFSYRVIARKVGFKSAGHFTLILNGKANISVELALKFAACLKLRKVQTQYFEYMVLYNQAKTLVDRLAYFKKMVSYRETKARVIAADQFAFYEKWHHSVIRALLDIVAVKDDFTALARMVVPPVTPQEARESVALMERLRLVKRDRNGCWRPTELLITTGTGTSSLALNAFVVQGLRRAAEAIDRFPKEQRNLSCVTLGVSQKGFEQIQQELREFRRRAMQIAERDEADTVYQLNLQLFPASRRRADKDGPNAR